MQSPNLRQCTTTMEREGDVARASRTTAPLSEPAIARVDRDTRPDATRGQVSGAGRDRADGAIRVKEMVWRVGDFPGANRREPNDCTQRCGSDDSGRVPHAARHAPQACSQPEASSPRRASPVNVTKYYNSAG